MRQSSSACQNRAKSCWWPWRFRAKHRLGLDLGAGHRFAKKRQEAPRNASEQNSSLGPGVLHALSVCPCRIQPEENRRRRSRRRCRRARSGSTSSSRAGARTRRWSGWPGIAVPTREDMQEIEISSRLYIENGARYMTATLMCAADTENPRTTAVTFILAGHRLVTVRYDEPKPFMLVENKLARGCAPGITGEMVLMELLDAVIDRNADILERAGGDMDTISHDIFEPAGAGAHRPRQALFRHPDRDRAQGRPDLEGAGKPGLDRPGGDVRRRRHRRRQMVEGHARAAEDHAARRHLADRPRQLPLQQDHLRARRHARRRQSRAEQHHQAVFGDGGGA